MYASKYENAHPVIDMTSLETILLNPKQAQSTIPYSPVKQLGCGPFSCTSCITSCIPLPF